ncbi:MAG: Fe-S cluster assembly scaffold protein NifU [Heliobacteriaceae bacterium]|nr:Fe-S cluster assembly scaffold protein NifU [Heliobacteriaceae bacterium]MDD4587135.1 Fe-S cluster assembly scaffold protein NifU [Heliobacteriaceae bacterium]
MEYSAKVIEHFTNPRNVGEMDNPSGVGEVGSPVCGDVTRIHITVENNRIKEAKFRTFGCGAAIASGSMCTEMVKGKTIDEALALTDELVAEALGGLPAVKMHCSNLAAEALHKAIEDYQAKQVAEEA